MSNGINRFYEFGPFRIDLAERLLLRDGESVALPPKDFEILLMLVENHGHLLQKDELMSRVWPDTHVEDNNLPRHVFNVRKALGEGEGMSRYIETVPKRGYRFVGEVRGVPDPKSVRAAVPDPTVTLQSDATTVRKRHWPPSIVFLLAAAGVTGMAVVGYFYSRLVAETSLKNATFIRLTDAPGEELFPSLSADGKSFLYASRASGNWDVYLQRVGGRTSVNLTKDSLSDDTQPVFSPDGERIAFRSERDGGGIFIMGATGESAKRLTDFGYNPAWSPDGKQIVCATEGFVTPGFQYTPSSRLFLVDVSTGEKRALTPEAEHAAQPSWSPHANRIAYWAVRDGRIEIHTVSLDGRPTTVTDGAYMDWNPVWSPDGNYLYFSSDRSGSMNLWRVRMNEQSGKALATPEPVTTPSPYSGHASFSQDGRKIAYVEQIRRSNLYSIAFDPVRGKAVGQPQPITQGLRELIDPDLSPDGEWLAFASRGKEENIFVIRVDGTGLRQVTVDAYRKRAPRWSPDGKRIALQCNRTGRFEIWTVNPDGSELQQLTYESRGSALACLWSPDGARLVYTIRGLGFVLMDVRKPWKEQPLEAASAGGWFAPMDWSPDGRKLAGHLRRSADGLSGGIATYSVGSRQIQRLTQSGSFPVWLNDGRRLLFTSAGSIRLIDSLSKQETDVLSVVPSEVYLKCAISRDNRLIYFSLLSSEDDVWLINLE